MGQNDDRERAIPSVAATLATPQGADGSAATLDGTSSGLRPADAARASLVPTPLEPERYRPISELGRGGMGVVRRVRDTVLGRDVAEKRLLGEADERARLRFLEEARATAQLEHPSIVPVYDLRDDHGEATFTMRLVGGRSLREILTALRAGDAETAREHGPTALLFSFLKICDGVAYAHARGVLHRDLKPENVMLGRFGEVFVMDWGLARVRAAPSPSAGPGAPERPVAYATLPDAAAGTDVVSVRDSGVALTHAGAILGTPGYMAPEQIRGDAARIGPAADVFALGAILFELLTLEPAVRGAHTHARLVATLVDPIPTLASAAGGRPIPTGLEAVVERALEKDPEARFGSVTALADAVRAALEGSERAARRREAAAAKLALARDALGRHHAEKVEHDEALRTRALRQVRLDDDAGRRALFREEAAIERIALRVERSFWDAYALFRGAIEDDPLAAEARAAVLDVLLARADDVEREGEAAAARTLRELARRHDPEGVAARLDRAGRVRVAVDAAGARASLHALVREGPILVETPVPAASDVAAPVDLELEPGSYVASIAAPGHATVRASVVVRSGQTQELDLALPAAGDVLGGFVVIPGGTYPMGGDPRAPGSEPARRATLATFAIMRCKVTLGAYAEFLNALPREEALARAPRLSGIVLWTPDAGGWSLPFVDREGDTWDAQWPIFGVSALDAEAYAAFRGGKDGARLRLPTADEWEAAARGMDDRVFPWGHGYDPSLAWCLDWNVRTPRPVGTRPLDRSVFGVLDLAGLAREWTATSSTGSRIVRGGAWQAHGDQLRIGRRTEAPDTGAYLTWGFRLVQELAAGRSR